jgi:histidine ammonia-lyase
MLKTETKVTRPVVDITFDRFTLADLCSIADGRPLLRLAPDVRETIARGSRYVAEIASQDRHTYGVNTGFGSLCETQVSADEMSELQHRHLLSHACGIGEPVPERTSRITMLVKLLTFRAGRSGITPELVQRLLDFWNADVIPVIPEKGTVGASGDLAPLAHMSLPLVGLGQVYFHGEIVDTQVAMADKGWQPARLAPKEGLALTNGVQYVNARGAEAVVRCAELAKCADLIAALSIQGFSCAATFYQRILHATSLHEDRGLVAANLLRLTEGSNHHSLPGCNVAREDPYSFRCAPQVHAAVRQTVNYASDVIEKECNSVSDNPLFFSEHDQVLLGGSLHGESAAFAMDFLAIAMSELACIAERRTYQLLSGQHGLPSFLVAKPGLDSGLMVVQYTSAALVNQNKVLATPASIDTIPTCQLQEDHVSMAGTSAYKLAQIIDNCEYVMAIELLAAAQAIDLNPELRLSPAVQPVFDDFRAQIPFLRHDRIQSADIELARDYLVSRRRKWAVGLN